VEIYEVGWDLNLNLHLVVPPFSVVLVLHEQNSQNDWETISPNPSKLLHWIPRRRYVVRGWQWWSLSLEEGMGSVRGVGEVVEVELLIVL
jgi:hypothetical protein